MTNNAIIYEKDSVNRSWSEAGIGNAFIFGKVMSTQTDLLLELLQLSLPEMHIRSIRGAGKEVDIKLSMDAHGVRLDVLVLDDQGRSIDVEMQVHNEQNVGKRMRYYCGAIDQTQLEAGTEYSDLPETVVLFITDFDPFDRQRLRYTFRNICIEDRDLEMQDGSTKVILNAKGTIGDISEDLRGFLDLVTGIAPREEGSFADRVQKQVILARQNSQWRREYMDWEMTLRHERAVARKEGVKEGLKEGLKEGMKIGELRSLSNQIIKKVEKGKSLPAIAEELESDVDTIRPIYEAVVEAAPDYNEDRIVEDVLRRRNPRWNFSQT